MVAVSPPEWLGYRWAEARRGVKTGRDTKGHMARGFWRGLFHGGVASVAAVAALSLAVPLQQPEPAREPGVARPVPMPQPAPVLEPVPELTPEPTSVPRPAPSAARPVDSPVAGAVDLPVGSEFGRGGDVVPRLPAPLAVERPAQPEAPAVAAPTSEPAPVAVTAADPRPEPAGGRDGPVQTAPVLGEDAPALDRPDALARRATANQPNRLPSVRVDAPLAVRPEPEPEPEPEPVRAPVATPTPSPGLPAPMPDLSLPPDLSDLQGLARD